MGRAPCCDKANVKRGPWSPEEDAKLKSYIENHGTGGNWIALPQKIGLKRCGKSCRLRWLNYLRPDIKHGGFTEDEDNLICNLYISIGSRWSIIAAQLPGRTDNDIKNYWNTRLKKKLLGRQRREHARQPSWGTKQLDTNKGGHQYYSFNECFSAYPPPSDPVAPPLLQAGYPTRETRMYELVPNSHSHISIMPPVDENFSHDHPQPNKFGNFCDASDASRLQNQQLCKNPTTNLGPSTLTSLMNSTCPPLRSDFHGISGLPAKDFLAFEEIPEDMMYSVLENLDGIGSFSGVDVLNSSTATSFPESRIGRGDASCPVYSSALSNYELYQGKVPQDWRSYNYTRLLEHPEQA